ncbi:hypothetical protein MLD38_000537 [Melastoma candidum]|uniref:Uncharacterized protein n=1 Tax=Melastoma candidum TaxID=119954 RepID=A0ACB9SAI3_9MYRT|nr:hypothetical protein MLD38_000537 [Melastoma candidum]
MSAVGFDIGNENCVVAIVKQRGIDVLLNDESKRETPAVVCFGEKQRFLGSAGAASATMHPKMTVSQVKKLVGRKFADPEVQTELQRMPFETCEGPDGGILVRVQYAGEVHTFSPVQIMAMLFTHLKDISEKNMDMPVSDCVIGVPSYFTDLQRREYLNAAVIAGLKPLRLLHDCTATALSYGIYKTDITNKSPINVAFVDIGHCDTQVCIASFNIGHMKILSHSFDCSLGGRDFDEVLFDHFAKQFKEEYKIDVYANVKASIRLRAACEKIKKILSANAEAPLNIECLMDEKDVKGHIKRDDFERLASGLFDRIGIPCRKALADAGLPLERLHSVELVGSGSRIPAVGKLLTSIFRKEPSRTLNASECVARGCALQCAMLSPAFRVREYEVQDSIPFSIGILLDGVPVKVDSNDVLFPRRHPIPSFKALTFHKSGTFHLEVFYAKPDELPSSASPKISCFTIGPFKSVHGEKIKVKVRILINLHGIVTVDSAKLIEEHVDGIIARGDGGPEMDRMDVDPTLDAGSASRQNGAEDVYPSKPSQSSGYDARDYKSSKKHDIPVSVMVYGGMSHADLCEALEKEIQLAQQDRIAEQTKERKNALESFVYDMRNKLFNSYRSFATDVERDGISRSLQQTEDWLYDEGDDETENAYAMKLEDLKKLVDPVESRYKEEEARAQASKDLMNSITNYRSSANSLPHRDRELMMGECFKAEQWLKDKSQLQDSLPKNNDPVLWSSEIRSRAEALARKCSQVTKSSSHSGDSEGATHKFSDGLTKARFGNGEVSPETGRRSSL